VNIRLPSNATTTPKAQGYIQASPKDIQGLTWTPRTHECASVTESDQAVALGLPQQDRSISRTLEGAHEVNLSRLS